MIVYTLASALRLRRVFSYKMRDRDRGPVGTAFSLSIPAEDLQGLHVYLVTSIRRTLLLSGALGALGIVYALMT